MNAFFDQFLGKFAREASELLRLPSRLFKRARLNPSEHNRHFELCGNEMLNGLSKRKPCRSQAVISLPLNYQPLPPASVPRVCVILHAFYVDDLREFSDALKNITYPFSLFVSTDSEEKRIKIHDMLVDLRPIIFEVRVFPNRGRDIAPKFVGFRDVYSNHDLVLHIHTKKSLHDKNVTNWRGFLLACLLGSEESVNGIFEMFRKCPQLGVVAPRNFEIVQRWIVWGINFDACAKLASEMGISIDQTSPLDFAAGSMFWARTAALKPLLDLSLTWDRFAEEEGQIDGELQHAIERLTFYSCEISGLSWIHAGPTEHPYPSYSSEEVRHVYAEDQLERTVLSATVKLIPEFKHLGKDMQARAD